MISVIIPCHDDTRLRQCLASIDDTDVEVVISLNGSTPEIEEIADDFARHHPRTMIIKSAEPNLAAALEAGSVRASSNTLLYMDSDCRFVPGAISVFKNAARVHPVVKGAIVFESNSRMSRIIARSREHHTAEVITAYKPPLAIHTAIRERIGGYYFDERLRWREDSDLDYRIRKARIPIAYEPHAVIVHPPLTLKQDFVSAYRYGVGLARAEWYGIALTEVPRSVMSTLRSKGLIAATYMVFRNRAYNLGTVSEKRRLRNGAKKGG